MTEETIHSALNQCESLIRQYGTRDNGKHVLSMINRARPLVSNPAKREKVMRWLGRIQGWLWGVGIADLKILERMR